MATSKPTDRQAYTHMSLQCSPASVGLTQAHPNYLKQLQLFISNATIDRSEYVVSILHCKLMWFLVHDGPIRKVCREVQTLIVIYVQLPIRTKCKTQYMCRSEFL